ncbi:MAG: iron chelate uptake ABC transporter family permease subunit [Acidimicrobiia bacterium]
MSIFNNEFVLRAFIATILIGFAAPFIGTYVVQRKLSLVGDGLGHVAAAGVGLALWFNFAPQLIAIVATVIAAIAIEWIMHTSKNSDTALAVIFYSGIGASIIFAGKSSNQLKLQQYLFGSLLTISWTEIIYLAIICLVVVCALFFIWRYLLSISIDEDSAKIAGVNTHMFHIAIMTFVALIVSISISITGILLISAVMVIPVLSAKTIGKYFYQTWIFASVLGVIGSVLGFVLSTFFDLAPGGTIVITHIFIFGLMSIITKLKISKI